MDDLISRGQGVIARLDAIRNQDGPTGQRKAARAFAKLNAADKRAHAAAMEANRLAQTVENVKHSKLGVEIQYEVAAEKYREELRAKMVSRPIEADAQAEAAPAAAKQVAAASAAPRPAASRADEGDAGYAAGFKAGTDRAIAVMGSIHVEGRKDQALKTTRQRQALRQRDHRDARRYAGR